MTALSDHDLYMRRALELAARGLGHTSPNPPVGAVVVQEGRILAEGYHRRAGEPHAEREALMAAGDAARGATLYCTLEPCCHHGRTPPCTDLIIERGVSEVYYGASDPDPRCAGRGEQTLVEAGVRVHAGLLADEVRRALYEPYFKHKRSGLPFVSLKLACSLDGKVATASGDSRWVTGEESRRLVHQWRQESDAVMVGIGTVLTDDPQLTARPPEGATRQPLRVVADTRGRTPPTAQVLGPGCLIAVGEEADDEAVRRLEQAGAEVLRLPSQAGRLDLPALMAQMGSRDVMSVMVEGGPTLAAALWREGLADRLLMFYAPRLIGGEGLSALGGLGLAEMSQTPALTFTEVKRVGNDVLIVAYPCSPD